MKTLLRYIKIWLLFAKQELLFQFSSKSSIILFFIGKTVRFLSFLLILILLKHNTKTMAGYSIDEVIIFFLTFNFIDLVSQMFMRGVYSLTGKVRSGELDFYLAKPVNVLFRVLAGSPDFNDVLIFIPFLFFSAWYIGQAVPLLDAVRIVLYLAFLVNGLLISVAFHIFVACIGIITTEVDNTIMLYRELSQMGRMPMEIYREPLRFLITFVVPVGLMVSIPARVLLGKAPPSLLLTASLVAFTVFLLSLLSWKHALKMYTSASS